MALTSSIHLTCLCGAISEPDTLLSNPELPTSAEICHCNTCRYTTGSLGVSFPALKSSPSHDTLSKLTPYASSKTVTRYFCSVCGCHCFLLNHEQKQWYCLSGIIEPSTSFKATSTNPPPKDTIKISHHAHVLDTLDGGLTPLLLNLNGRSIPTWSGARTPAAAPHQASFDLPHATILSLPRQSSNLSSTSPHSNAPSYLPAKCHCGGVSLLIKPANYTPDIVARHVPSNPAKYLTYLCACRSCRLATGVPLTPWTLVLPANVFNAKTPTGIKAAGAPSPPDEAGLQPVLFGGPACDAGANPGLQLRHYWSSPDVIRSFCGVCGATVFYWCGQRPDELDLAVGVFRAEEGSMARSWLEWVWGRCSSIEESIDKEMSDAWAGCAEVMERIGG